VPAYTPEWLAAIYGVGWVALGFVFPKQTPGENRTHVS
jgi:hypothetical protein